MRRGNHVDIGLECVGCHACATACPQSCITMTADSHGFLYPVVDTSCCSDCGLCRTACPVIDRVSTDVAPLSYACHASDDTVRRLSSSGGVFTLLAEYVIERGGAAFGAVFDDEFCVLHQGAQDSGQLARLRGSKYVQSKMGAVYANIAVLLEEGRGVLFSGTPCQTAGLRSFLGVQRGDLLCVDLVCHGVPSPYVWKQYVSFQENVHGAPLREATFRDKATGWRSYSVRLEFANGAVYRETVARDPYMRAFLQDICLRPSCYECRFKGLSRDSDITLADFWGIERVAPEMDDGFGTSLVMVHSSPGQLALGAFEGRLVCQPVDTESAVMGNPAVMRSARRHPRYDEFFRDLSGVSFDRLVATHCRQSLSTRARSAIVRTVRRLRDYVRNGA